jgi:hypothetical protein
VVANSDEKSGRGKRMGGCEMRNRQAGRQTERNEERRAMKKRVKGKERDREQS